MRAGANFRTTRFCWWVTRHWRSHQNKHKTLPSKSFSLRFFCKWFLCFYFWAVIWSYIVDLFAALHELASASARTLLKLASSVRALFKPNGDTLSSCKNKAWKKKALIGQITGVRYRKIWRCSWKIQFVENTRIKTLEDFKNNLKGSYRIFFYEWVWNLRKVRNGISFFT